MSLRFVLGLIMQVNWIKSFYFNFHYFSFYDALKLPALVYRRTVLKQMGGTIEITGKVSSGMMRIGIPRIGVQDLKYSRTIWSVGGGILINGVFSIGRGCRICIGKNGIIKFGDNFRCTGDSSIFCYKKISFGDDCLLSWDIQIMDTDFHVIRNQQQRRINDDGEIKVGNRVWIGCRSTILKGVSIPSGSVIAAESIISSSKAMTIDNSVYGGVGNDLVLLKDKIKWAID